MSENNELQYKKCYVAFLDILGFKNYVASNPCEALHRVLSYLEIEAAANPWAVVSKYEIKREDVNILCISDSVIVSIEECPHALDAILWLCAAFQLTLLLNAHLLMRGGISCGDFYIDNSAITGDPILFGPAYNNAVELEQSGKCGGRPVILVDEVMNLDDLENHALLSQDDEYNQLFVNYMHNAKKVSTFDMKMSRAAEEIVNRIKEFKRAEDSAASKKEKYTWTKDYIARSLGDEDVFSEESIAQYRVDPHLVSFSFEFCSSESDDQ